MELTTNGKVFQDMGNGSTKEPPTKNANVRIDMIDHDLIILYKADLMIAHRRNFTFAQTLHEILMAYFTLVERIDTLEQAKEVIKNVKDIEEE